MSKQADESKTQSQEAGSAVLSDTIEGSKSAQLRGKVKGKFLRLTMADGDIPVFVRSADIGAYHDVWKQNDAVGLKLFEGCWLTGPGFGFSVKEYAEDIQALIAQVEGEYTRSELGEALIALLIAAGMGASEACLLLSSGPREKLAAEVVKLCDALTERRQIAEAANAASEEWDQLVETDNEASEKWDDLIEAGVKLHQALGGESTDTFHDDPAAATVRCIEQAISKLHDKKLRYGALLDKAGGIRAMAVQEQVKREELMRACDKVLQAFGISEEDFGKEADHGAMLRLLEKSAERIDALKADAATNLQTCDELSRKVTELEDRIAVSNQARTAAEASAAYAEKEADELRARLDEPRMEREIVALKEHLDEALQLLPKEKQESLAAAWKARQIYIAGGRS